MAYVHDGWTLYKRDVELKRSPKSGEPCDKPDNMTVGINKRTGLPYLKKK